jgi:ferredoxin
MHDYLRGTRTDVVVRKQWTPAAYTMAERWNTIPRRNPPVLETEVRAASLANIEDAFADAEARRQGARCLRCNVNTVFDTGLCVACNGCVDVCPENLIRLVGLSQLVEDPVWLDRAQAEFGDLTRFSAEELDQLGGVMMKDETTCIRCSLCASRCPTHAILMKRFEFSRECVAVATPNSKVRYGA